MTLREVPLKDGTKNLIVIRSYRKPDGKTSTKIVRTLGNTAQLMKEHADPYAWAKSVVKEMTDREKEEKLALKVMLPVKEQLEKEEEVPAERKRRKNIGNKRVDLDDNCIDLIVKAYNDFIDRRYEDNEISVESKVFDNDYFGYTKVVVETPICDESGNPILKKGKPQADKAKTDTENIPLQEDIDEYIKKNVLPYNPLAYLDRKKDKIGYEIPFTRIFYKFVPPTPSEDIFNEIKKLEAQETELMKELFSNE